MEKIRITLDLYGWINPICTWKCRNLTSNTEFGSVSTSQTVTELVKSWYGRGKPGDLIWTADPTGNAIDVWFPSVPHSVDDSFNSKKLVHVAEYWEARKEICNWICIAFYIYANVKKYRKVQYFIFYVFHMKCPSTQDILSMQTCTRYHIHTHHHPQWKLWI